MGELDLIYAKLDGACCPEEVFGLDPISSFRQLAKACHPDHHPARLDLAQKTFAKLTVLKREADARLRNGQWGKNIPLAHCIPVEIGKYKVKPTPIIGDICDLYVVENQDAIVKVARSHDDNDLLRAEAAALRVFDNIDGPVRQGVPHLIDAFQVHGTWKREANVVTNFPGFVSALDVHQKMQVDSRTAVWMFKRILVLLGWVHHLHFIHGAILPPHVMFYPDNDGEKGMDERKHSVRVIDWSYSVNYKNRTKLSSWVPAWKDFYAPELLDKSYIGPESDIYMAAKLMLYLMQTTLFMPELQKVLLKCLNSDPKKRYQNTGDAFEDWKKASISAFGSPKWIEFNLP